MKKYIWPILCLVLVLSPLGFLGCEETVPVDTGVLPVGTRLANLEAKDVAIEAAITTLQQTVPSKAESATVTAQGNRIATLEGQSAANTYPKGELYTRSQVDDIIRELKDDQSWITGRTSTSAGTTTGEWGELLDEDGDLELWLEKVSGDISDEFRTRQGENSGRFDLIVVNLDNSSHDFRLYLDFEPDVSVVLSDNSSVFNKAKTEAESSGGLTFTVSRSPNSGRSLLSCDQSNTGRILKGDAEDYTIWVTIHQLTDKVVDWDYDIRIKDKD